VTLETSVTGTVSLDADKKGINMSRIMRSFYAHAEKRFSINVIEAALDDYKTDLDSFDARIQMRFSFPDAGRKPALGPVWLAVLRHRAGTGRPRRAAAPFHASGLCLFLDLPLLAGTERTCARGAAASWPRRIRSARSRGSRSRCCRGDALVRGPDRHLPRRRADRDAGHGQARGRAGLSPNSTRQTRSLSRMPRGSSARALAADPRIGDFRVVASHQESLHSHDAVSLLTEGPTFAAESLDPRLFASLSTAVDARRLLSDAAGRARSWRASVAEPPMPPILTITLNPALDLAGARRASLAGPKLRVTGLTVEPGGGGINVARVIHRLGWRGNGACLAGRATGARIAASARSRRRAGPHASLHRAIPDRASPSPTRATVSNTASSCQVRNGMSGTSAALDATAKAALAGAGRAQRQPAARVWRRISRSVWPHALAARGARLIVDTSGGLRWKG
jgi:hypothetical protein